MSAKILASTENMDYADWLKYRKQGISGSDASMVCGISRYKSPVELWMEKKTSSQFRRLKRRITGGTQLESHATYFR